MNLVVPFISIDAPILPAMLLVATVRRAMPLIVGYNVVWTFATKTIMVLSVIYQW